jgi:hypothetical protein
MGWRGKIPFGHSTGLLNILAVPIVLALASCPPQVSYSYPEASIKREFSSQGKVKYTLSGTDKDGKVTKMQARINGGAWSDYPPDGTVETGIIPGANSCENIAVDNQSLRSVPKKLEFNSPTQEEAEKAIEEALQGKDYAKNVFIPLGEQDGVSANYFLTLPDGRNAVIRYFPAGGDLAALAESVLLEQYGLPCLDIVGFPIDATKDSIGEFLKQYFQ